MTLSFTSSLKRIWSILMIIRNCKLAPKTSINWRLVFWNPLWNLLCSQKLFRAYNEKCFEPVRKTNIGNGFYIGFEYRKPMSFKIWITVVPKLLLAQILRCSSQAMTTVKYLFIIKTQKEPFDRFDRILEITSNDHMPFTPKISPFQEVYPIKMSRLIYLLFK